MTRRNTAARSRKPRRAARAPKRAPAVRSPEAFDAERRARDEPVLRNLALVNFFWHDCPTKACRRTRRCTGAEPCFTARWLALPAEERDWRRDWVDGLHRFKDFEKAHAFARERARERERRKVEYEALRAAGA